MELQANEVAISKGEYNSLLQDKARIETLEKKIADLEQETKNKSTALQEARSKSKEEKEILTKEIASKTEELNNVKLMLGISQEEPIGDKLSEVLTGFESYKEVLQKEQETRTANIENYKKTLGDKFLNSKSDLLNGLDDKKTEILLKEFVEAKGSKEEPIKVGVHNDGLNIADKKSDFEKAVSIGASTDVLLDAMLSQQ